MVYPKAFSHIGISVPDIDNGIGIELFEFIKPEAEKRENNFEYWKSGIFHFCLVDPDIEEFVKKIVENGGKTRSQIYKLFPDKPYKMAYCEDPYGNVFEVYTHSYEQFFGNTSY